MGVLAAVQVQDVDGAAGTFSAADRERAHLRVMAQVKSPQCL